MDAGLLPVKELSDANQRLSAAFTNEQRLEISRALVADALDLCEKTSFFRWLVVTSDSNVAQLAKSRGFEVVEDPGHGLNAALDAGIKHAMDAGAKTATVLPVDVPLATSEDVRDLLDTGAISDVALVPSHSDGGTNALYLSPANALQPRFGPMSLSAHVGDAERRGLRCSILDLPRLALDVDTPDDAKGVVEKGGASQTVQVLRRLLRENA